jgi:carbon monoxide dehydrogenase subunit G
MRLRNEVVVGAPVEQTWSALLDVPRVAGALPGATIEPAGEAGLYRGTMRVKLGPVSATYEGVARLQEVDEDARVAVFHVQGRERGGQGAAAATITNRLAAADGGTRVEIDTDLNVTGRAAQLGRGLLEDVAARLVSDFAGRLEREVLTGAAPAEPEAEALDLGQAAWEPLARRYAAPAAAFALGVLVGLGLRRR